MPTISFGSEKSGIVAFQTTLSMAARCSPSRRAVSRPIPGIIAPLPPGSIQHAVFNDLESVKAP
ncbi:hypothetical protein ACB309_11400 [Klebsiella pneumoniae]